ncbi:hypothetical protein C8Q75DRAFT_541335 [Abortiporus biennis]|nr:hypothetical protein C8Q75DRAFT_541335 [Abortiporus biennis]
MTRILTRRVFLESAFPAVTSGCPTRGSYSHVPEVRQPQRSALQLKSQPQDFARDFSPPVISCDDLSYLQIFMSTR